MSEAKSPVPVVPAPAAAAPQAPAQAPAQPGTPDRVAAPGAASGVPSPSDTATPRAPRTPWNETPDRFRFFILLGVPAAAVFKALTDSDGLTRWLCRKARATQAEFELSWASQRPVRWKVGAYEKDKTLELLRPESLRFSLSPEKDGRTRLEVEAQLHRDGAETVDEKVLWSVHLMYLKAYLENGVDLREADASRAWKDGYVNGAEPA